ncbi:MAG: MarP family serine protease [Thermoleophilia bacterium]
MTTVDWIALVVVAVAALSGLRKGLIGSALSLVGIVAGAMLGARLAPALLSGGSRSPWTPLIALGGASVGAIALQTVGALVGTAVRRALVVPPLRALDTLGGALLGALAGLALIWIVASAALLLPGQTALRRGVQRSHVLRTLNDIVPPRRLLAVLARVDPFPHIAAPPAPVQAPDPRVLRDPAVARAAPSIVRVLGTACGLGVAGSGWVVRPGLVVTAAHVVAGQHDTTVQPEGVGPYLPARAVLFDPRNDVAILSVAGLSVRALPVANPVSGRAVAILGFPGNGPLTVTAARVGLTATVLSQDAYGHGPVGRTITSIRGPIRHGDSGGPAVDANGAVEATVFASRLDGKSGFGVPSDLVLTDVARARQPVSTRKCS